MNRPAIGHVATVLLRQIGAVARIDPLDREKTIIVVNDIRATDWASLTFVGQRFEFDLRLDGDPGSVADAIDRLDKGIADAEIAIKGHFVAEIRVIPVESAAVDEQPIVAGRLARNIRIDALVLRD